VSARRDDPKRPGGPRVRVAVVDDSTFIRKALERMLRDHPQIEIAGSASSGEELLANLERWRPDVVTLDLDMPGMGGLETLDHLMARRPLPVIIMSTHSGEGAPLTIEALHRGAVDFIDKQRYSLVDFAALRAVLLDKIFHVTGTELQEDVADEPDAAESSTEIPSLADWAERRAAPEPPPSRCAFDLIAIGASTGGPPTVQAILEDLGASVPVPILVAQHMPVGFTQAFAERLNAHLALTVREAQDGERLLPSTVYIGPAGQHLRVRRGDEGLRVELGRHPESAAHKPSVDVLFRSVATAAGRRAIGILLTGMGRDGARGLARVRDVGGHTLVQDEASSVVYGMPRAAVMLDAAREVLPASRIGPRLRELLARSEPENEDAGA